MFSDNRTHAAWGFTATRASQNAPLLAQWGTLESPHARPVHGPGALLSDGALLQVQGVRVLGVASSELGASPGFASRTVPPIDARRSVVKVGYTPCAWPTARLVPWSLGYAPWRCTQRAFAHDVYIHLDLM